MNYTFNVKKDTLTENTTVKLISGNENTYILTFTFDNDWTGFTKFAVFTKDGRSYNVEIVNNSCIIPYQILTSCGNFQFGVYGVLENNNVVQRLSTNVYSGIIEEGAYKKSIAPKVREPELWERLLSKYIPKIINGYWYIYDLNSLDYVNSNVPATSVPQKGVDYFTAEDIASLGITAIQNSISGISADIAQNDLKMIEIDDKFDEVDTSIASLSQSIQVANTDISDVESELEDKEDTANRLNSMSQNPSNAHYLSEKAVYDFVNSSINQAVLSSWEVAI